mgnify:CR=1 FL=1
MGNIVSNSSEDSIGFRHTNIDKYSGELPIDVQLGKDVKQVINNIPTQQQEQQGGGNFSEESLGMNEIFQKLDKNTTTLEQEFTDTSIFVSSEMYNFLMKGGAKKKKSSKKQKKSKKSSKKSKGGEETVEPQEQPQEQPEEHHEEHHEQTIEATSETEDSTEEEKKKKKEESEEEGSDADLDYESSSAHEGTEAPETVTKGRKYHRIHTPDTSDINLITE